MNYELAKQLKDAGFPQKELTGMAHCNYKGTADHSHSEKCICEEVTFPTLSELAEACGEGFWSLHKTRSVNGDRFYANSILESEGCSSPEEAVARLYLELHKK